MPTAAQRRAPIEARASANARGYNNKWRSYRLGYLRSHPLCAMCHERGLIRPASVVDHIEPHRGDMRKFWDTGNHQALCAHCHNSHKKRLEMSGTAKGCNEAGVPIDPRHHWSQAGEGAG